MSVPEGFHNRQPLSGHCSCWSEIAGCGVMNLVQKINKKTRAHRLDLSQSA